MEKRWSNMIGGRSEEAMVNSLSHEYLRKGKKKIIIIHEFQQLHEY